MKPTLFLLLLLATQTSCSGVSESCSAYADAVKACNEIAEENELESVDMETGDSKEFCKEMGDLQTDEQWECMAKAFEEAECSTDAGWIAVGPVLTDCDPTLD
jgi:hypothetical protein